MNNEDLVQWARTAAITGHDPRVGRLLSRRMLVRLAELAEPGTAVATVTRGELAVDLGVRADTIKRTVRFLDRANLLTRVQVLHSNGFTAVIAYYLSAPGSLPPPARIVRDEPLRPHQGPGRGLTGIPKLGTGRALTDADRTYLDSSALPLPYRVLLLALDGVDRSALEAALGLSRQQLYGLLQRTHKHL